MSEYWKSLPRKFCEACKCWFADNKASIEFHERGKRHKENVEKRLADLRKKGKKDFEDSSRYEKAMAKIEQAALAAYRKDVESNPSLAAKPKVTSDQEETTTKKGTKSSVAVKDWWEGKDEEGNLYYWSSKSGESRWEPPDEPFVSIEEQEGQQSQEKEAEEESKSESANETCEVTEGPQMRVDPYGQWTTIKNTPAPTVDLQLPFPPADMEAIAEEQRLEDAAVEETLKNRFKEKTVQSLGKSISSEGDGTFKKRKGFGDAKRNVRRRTDDE